MSSAQLSLFWPDGEKIPDEQLQKVYRHPPLVPQRFNRGTLVVGSRGAGKTTLLRFQKETHDGVAVHIALNTELASLSKQTALGPLSPRTTAAQEELIGNKATSLLAISLVERLTMKEVPSPWGALRECIPGEFFPRTVRRSSDFFTRLKTALSRAPLDCFVDLPRNRPLVTLLSELGSEAAKVGQSLLLLFDKADLVIPAALLPVLETLDQAAGYVAVVATRPGHGGISLARFSGSISAGDHYDIIYLGLKPRSEEWRHFLRAAIEAQPGIGSLAGIASEIREAVIALSRDSVRVGLEAFAHIQAGGPAKAHESLVNAITDIRERQLIAAQTVLRERHPDFVRLIQQTRKHVVTDIGHVAGPVTLRIDPRGTNSLFEATSDLTQFLDSALRSAALCMADGQMWFPGSSLRVVEIPPHLIWEASDPLWSADDMKPAEVVIREAELFKTTGGPPVVPSIFIAYRLNNEDSKRFRDTLERALIQHPTLRCNVEDGGRIPVGRKWAPQIRDMIRRARLVVGDVERLRPEVLFELGFANGLRTPILPVVSELQLQISDLPYWLRATQLGHYADGPGVAEVVASIETHMAQSARTGAPRGAVSGLVVWLRRFDWNQKALEQAESAARREGVSLEVYDTGDSEDVIIERAHLATFLVISMDGTEWDAFGHFVCGTALAKPFAGYGAKRLERRIVILEPPAVKEKRFTAEGVSRCSETVSVIKPDRLLDLFDEFLRRRRLWEAGSHSREEQQ
jgi:hypothetical protein